MSEMLNGKVNTEVSSDEKCLSTPWFNVVARTWEGSEQPYYVLEQVDFVGILTFTSDNKVVLVKQYRPAVQDFTLELPGGHVDPGETPELAAKRELLEETGFESSDFSLLGRLSPDVGRQANSLWCYLAVNATPAKEHPIIPDEDIEIISVPYDGFIDLCLNGQLYHAPDLAIPLLMMIKKNKVGVKTLLRSIIESQ